jgi:hypothetical protein
MHDKLAVLAVAAMLGSGGQASAEEPVDATMQEFLDQGLLECQFPNARQKTCRAIGVYERIQEGVYNSTTLIAQAGGVTVETYTPVWLTDGALCGSIREQDVMTWVIRINGREVPPQRAAAALQQQLNRLRPLIDRDVCSRYEPSGDGLVARYTIDGELQPEFDTPVRLISLADGYRVAR